MGGIVIKTYTTIELARMVEIHPNTVRLYEELGLLPKIPRKENGYRVFGKLHLEQLKLIRIGLKSELLQNGLRKQVIEIIKTSATGDYNKALMLLKKHIDNIRLEKHNAKEAIRIVECDILEKTDVTKTYTRKQLADSLSLKIDTLRNWELNGLISIKRKENGYRVYNEEDIKKIKIIRALRCSNFSLTSILRLLQELQYCNDVNVEKIINTPNSNEEIVSVCDKLLTSLDNAEVESNCMIKQIKIMKKINPPL